MKKGLHQMSDARDTPGHAEKDETLVGMKICHVGVVIGKAEAPLNLHHP